MKKILVVCVLAIMSMNLISCGKSKVLHCDNCGKEVKVAENSKMDDDWILYCSDCEKELGLDKVVQ